MKKFVSFFSSMMFTGILAAVFAVSAGCATFIENSYDTVTAKILIYNSKWFEVLFLLICLNLIGSIFKYRLINKKKWTILLFHIAFIIIIAGAAITRYFGFEGSMHIREGEVSNVIISENTFLNVKAAYGEEVVEKEQEIQLSAYTANHYSEKLKINGQTVRIRNLQYSPFEYFQTQQGITTANAVRLSISSGNESEELIIYERYGEVGQQNSVEINGITVTASVGSKIIKLPFSIHLTGFQLERYPGSNSPSSYVSEVILNDGATIMPYRIYMNNILKHAGYRFFQASYDTDEKGTILSVNYDVPGTGVTYFGYLVMAVGMVLTLFNKKSRFRSLLLTSAKLSEERKKFAAIVVGMFLLAFTCEAQSEHNEQLRRQHVSDFAELVIQNQQGRLEPVSTIASEILRKVAKETSFEGMSSTGVFLDMQANPEKWKTIPCIKVDNAELRTVLGIKGKYASLNDFISETGTNGYKLNTLVTQAYAEKSSTRNKFYKEIINVDERINIILTVLSADFLTIFPIPNHDNYKWASPNELDETDNGVLLNLITSYFAAVNSNNWDTATLLLDRLKQNQEQYGAQVIPFKTKIKLEVLYNNVNVFGKLFKMFLFTGLMLLVLQLVTLFSPEFKFRRLKQIAFVFIIILFIAETTGLAVRWYISGHAPWSSGYESIIFISWAMCLGGIIFARRSEITLSLTTVLAGLTLLVAGMSWMSPEITNLVPVLKSYWLVIHVSVITASYGFLGIGAVLGLLNLILMILRNRHNSSRINFTVIELVNVIQITLITGLFMLITGSFLGGIWANESWGRYWGWDPKETWALITIFVYAFVCHMHKIPGLKGNFQTSAAALLGFGFVLMTYFGVNYYLPGLHSYVQAEPVPILTVIYIVVIMVLFLIVTAGFSEKKLCKKPD